MTAVYARQSVERPDSISIEMQVETCIRTIPSETPYRTYQDCGFSGANMDRPAFREMMETIQQGEIQEVVVYKLDRISRSLCDFAGMMQIFRKFGVTLRSCRESFDTQSEIGGMLLNLLIMFAELEQKTIAGRVRDNYYARAVQRLPLGGTAPYGYRFVPTIAHGKKTRKLESVLAETEQILWFYTQYGVHGRNLEQIVHMANQQGGETRRHANWSNSAVLRLLRNPVYVKGNFRSCTYLTEHGVTLDHPKEAYCQGNGYLIYGSPRNRRGEKYSNLAGNHAAAGLHQGIVEASLWLSVQERLEARGGSCNRGTGHVSWLQGRVICGLCGERCYARNNGSGAKYTYFVCRGKRLGICGGIPALRTAIVEDAVKPILAQLAAEILPLADVPEENDPRAVELEELETQIQHIMDAIRTAADSAPFLQGELERLAKAHRECERRWKRCDAIGDLQAEKRWEQWWARADITKRRRAAELLLKEVEVFPGKIVVAAR